MPVAAALAGALFATSFTTAQGTDLRTAGRDLPSLVTAASRDVASKAEQVSALQSQVDALNAAAAPGNASLADITARMAGLAPGVGTTAVRGATLQVSLDDAHRDAASLPKPYGPDDIVVHQQDVQGVVNALWVGGAEAMMIQDQRIIATTAVQCVGNTLLLEGRVYSPPYVVTAIGDPDRMRAALEADPQVKIYREWVDAVGLGWDVTAKGSAELPAYTGPVSLDAVRGQ